MPTNGYTTVAAVKGEVGITDSADDTRLDRIVTAVSRLIDDYVGHPLYAGSGARYFRARSPVEVLTDPFTAFSEVAYDQAGDWATYVAITGAVASPFNATAVDRPYTGLMLGSGASASFPAGDRGVRVTATWGHGASTPAIAAEACILQCTLVFRTQMAAGSPLAGGGEYQGPLVQAGLHPLVRRMLDPLRTGASAGVA